jgi:hypothetical protein
MSVSQMPCSDGLVFFSAASLPGRFLTSPLCRPNSGVQGLDRSPDCCRHFHFLSNPLRRRQAVDLLNFPVCAWLV